MKECFETNKDINIALLQIGPTPILPELLSPATILFSRPVGHLLPKMNRVPMLYDFDDDNYVTYKQRQCAGKVKDTCKDLLLYP